MLVLTRKPGESIKIGSATIFINRLSAGQVSIAIDAPRELRILRGELEPAQDQPEAPKQEGER